MTLAQPPLLEGEQREHRMPTTLDAFLGDKLMLEQPAQGYRAGLDAVILAAAVTPDRVTRDGCEEGATFDVLDVGAGVGTAGLCVATRLRNARVTLAEREPALLALAAANLDRNALTARARCWPVDVLARPKADHVQLYDHVIANPPFHEQGHGTAAPDGLKARSHAMPRDALDLWARFIARHCRPGGTASMIMPATRLFALLQAFEGRFGNVMIRPLAPREGVEA
ncbi:MAG: methyltransferase, partial [Pseudomonadota bacterium]